MKRIQHCLLAIILLVLDHSANSQTSCNDGADFWISGKSARRIGFFPPAYLNPDTVGCYSFATGYQAVASGKYSVAMGAFTTAKAWGGVTLGAWNDDTDDPGPLMAENDRIFQIGNGTPVLNFKSNAMTVLHSGKTGIGIVDPEKNLSVKGGLNIDQADGHVTGQFGDNLLTFGKGSGEGIGSDRAGSNNHYGLNFYTAFSTRMTIANNGLVSVAGNLTVQNGKGIIRNANGTQLKKLSLDVTVNGSFAAGQTRSFNFTFPENFSSSPEAYVGNVTSGAGGWAELIISVAAITPTTGALFVYNPKSTAVTPNFNIKVIAIGPQ